MDFTFEKERLKVNYYKKLNEIYKQNYIEKILSLRLVVKLSHLVRERPKLIFKYSIILLLDLSIF